MDLPTAGIAPVVPALPASLVRRVRPERPPLERDLRRCGDATAGPRT